MQARYANVIGAAALILAAGTLVKGAISGPDGIIHGCYRKRTGIVRLVKPGANCRSNEAAVEWNQQGPQGVQGPQGQQGLQGPQGVQGAKGKDGTAGSGAAILWAVVNSAGSLQRGSGLGVPIGTDVSAEGNTRAVPFDRDLTDCAWVATIGGADLLSGTVDGFITTSLTTANTVTVSMSDKTGAIRQNQAFHLAVFCP